MAIQERLIVLLDRPAEQGEFLKQFLHPLDIESLGIVRGIGFAEVELGIALGEELIVIQVPVVRVDAEEVPPILRAEHLLLSHKGFKELFAMPRSDIFRSDAAMLQLQNRLSQGPDRRRGSLLNEQIALLAMLESV